ncbi:MAG: hypothetical protein JNJ47_03210 [Alphaproteobacteria bacterium]|nr:hypothetical protein [Alphaproteobacteria bacterium]
MRKLVSLFACVFMFQSSVYALNFCNKTDENLHYVVGLRKKGTSESFRELDVEKIAPGEAQKLKFKDSSEARKFLTKIEERREILSEKGSVLEVVIRIERLGDSENEDPVLYDRTICILENFDHLIRLHDFAHADFSKNEGGYTLNLTGLLGMSVS